MQRYFLDITYLGTPYCGWQRQPNGTSVQETIEQALGTILRQPIPITAAGRTDAGVHALHMTAHLDLPAPHPDTTRLTANLNSLLPPTIAINHMTPVSPTLHARFDALTRRYQYHITTHKDPILTDRAYRIHTPLDIPLMNQAAQTLHQYQDFTSFSKLHTDTKTNNCTIHHALWTQTAPHHIIFTIEANRFLRNMVRAIVGTLLDIGTHKITIPQFHQIILSKDRCQAGQSVPPYGLYFIQATYPNP